MSGVSARVIEDYETHGHMRPSVGNAYALMTVLDVTLEQLLGLAPLDDAPPADDVGIG